MLQINDVEELAYCPQAFPALNDTVIKKKKNGEWTDQKIPPLVGRNDKIRSNGEKICNENYVKKNIQYFIQNKQYLIK